MLSKILDLIKENDIITIFRHEMADGDAFGSQCGLASWLKMTFSDKEIYCLGEIDAENLELFCPMDQIDDQKIKASLAIVLDTANRPRIDDKRFALAKSIIKIDHHIEVDDYGDTKYVDTNKSSTCELIADVINKYQDITTIDQKTANFLYMGLLTDTNRFSTTNTSAGTLSMASKLAQTGIDVADLSYQIFKKNKNYFTLASFVRTQAVFEQEGTLAYVYVTKKIMNDYNVPYIVAKDLINEFNNVEGLLVWVLFIEDEKHDIGFFSGSLRSRKPIVNDIAANFGGGGHLHAAGTKGLTIDDTKRLLEMLKNRIKEQK